jgi:hypothetical protein
MEESKPPAPKKIRLTRAEAYAMQISSPRKKRLTFGLIGLLVAVALGAMLWHFQDWWLVYWLPENDSASPAITQSVETPPPAAPQPPAQAAIPAPEPQAPAALESELDFLSAAVWNHPQFLQAVRMFNEALDQRRDFLRDRSPSALPARIEEGAAQAAQVFEALRADAPPAVPLGEYIARCRQLIAEARRLGRPAQTAVIAPEPSVAPPKETPRPVAPPPRAGETWQDPDYLEGARLFNRALEQYKRFLADKSHAELLEPIEETAFQAAKKFEAIRAGAPTNVPVGDHISQCYKLISDCRRQNLEDGSADAGTPRERATVGPSHRPALPAYQPPP